MTRKVVFLFNLLQDVNMLRPLVLLARRCTDDPIVLLVSKAFNDRDSRGTWEPELKSLSASTQAQLLSYASTADAIMTLQSSSGLIFAGSESDVSAHHGTHDIFRAAPTSFLKVTLQHGMECVGFRQTREHDANYTRNVGFAADLLCTWQFPDALTAIKSSQRGKVLVTGPTSLLYKPRPATDHSPVVGGLICENLHSVRLTTTGDHDRPFMDIFRDFCSVEAEAGRTITLRPHPGGQYVLRKRLSLPANVVLNNAPIYRVDMREYAYGISAPSTIVLDMVLAGLPTAVWRDEAGSMDTRGFSGLTPISSLQDWCDFVGDVEMRPQMLLARQQLWLDGLRMQLDAAIAYERFEGLIKTA